MVFYAELCSDFPNHHPSVLFDESINFLLFVFSCDASWSTTTRLICSVCVSVMKVFHSPAGINAGISAHN
jgi:hypothetical protein